MPLQRTAPDTSGRIHRITDPGDPALDILTRMSENQLLRAEEPLPGYFIAESPRVMVRALQAGYEPVSVLAVTRLAETAAALADAHLEEAAAAADRAARGDAAALEEGADGAYRIWEPGDSREEQLAYVLYRCPTLPVYTAELEELNRMTGFPLTLGALCAMRRRPLPSVEEICAGARRIAVMESVVNPTNVGAIFRSAAALGIDGVLLTAACCDPLYRRAVRVSVGNVFQVPWTWIGRKQKDWNVEILHRLGFRTAAMALDDRAVPVDDPQAAGEEKLAIILGTEGEGLDPATIQASDYIVKIPMSHGVDSLNVAAASAVAFWALR